MAVQNLNVEALKVQFVRDFLELQDVGTIQKFLNLMKESRKSPSNSGEDVAGYDVYGNPFTTGQFLADIETDVVSYRNGHFTTSEEFEKEMESW